MRPQLVPRSLVSGLEQAVRGVGREPGTQCRKGEKCVITFSVEVWFFTRRAHGRRCTFGSLGSWALGQTYDEILQLHWQRSECAAAEMDKHNSPGQCIPDSCVTVAVVSLDPSTRAVRFSLTLVCFLSPGPTHFAGLCSVSRLSFY